MFKIKIGAINCKGYKNNKTFIHQIIKDKQIVFATETWMPGWTAEDVVDLNMKNIMIYTSNKHRENEKKKGT